MKSQTLPFFRVLPVILAITALAAPAPAAAYRGPVPILTYHELRAAPHGSRSPASASLWVPAARFRAQIQGLARKLNLLGEQMGDVEEMLRDVIERSSGGDSPPTLTPSPTASVAPPEIKPACGLVF